MKKFWNAHILLKLLFPLMLGIGLSSMVNYQNKQFIWLGFGIAILVALVATFLRFRSTLKWLSGALVAVAFFFFGFANHQLQQESIPQFIENYKAERQPFAVQVLEDPITKARSVGLLTQIEKHPNQGLVNQKAMIYLARNRQEIKKGDVLLINYFLNEIQPPKNPHEFDYRSFMQKKGVLYQAYLNDKQQVEIIPSQVVRPNLIQRIRNTGFVFIEKNVSEENQAVAKALLFGARDELTREISQEFAKAGTMHILAVSGLHVGIIFLLANSLLQFINRKIKLPKWLTVSVLLTIIWLFVFLTGAKASVMRAGIMFSLFVIGLHFFPKNYSLNTLALAAIILLTLAPNNLFDVGFQLSFSAVAGILLMVPTLQNLFPIPKWTIPKYLLDITYVSIAAQLATLPFTLYYFQQFPLLGLVSNLAAIPLSFCIVAVGFVGFLLSGISPIAQLLGKLLDVFLWALQSMNAFIADIDFAVVPNIYLTTFQCCLLFLSVAALAVMLKSKNTKLMLVSLFGLVTLAGSVAFSKWQVSTKQEFTVYYVNQNVVAQYQKGREVYFFAKNQITDDAFQFNILPNLKANYITKKSFYSMQESTINDQFLFKNQKLLLPNLSINFIDDIENTELKVDLIISNKQDYRGLYNARQLVETQEVVLANTYPNRSVSDTIAGMHFLNSEGFYSKDLTAD